MFKAITNWFYSVFNKPAKKSEAKPTRRLDEFSEASYEELYKEAFKMVTGCHDVFELYGDKGYFDPDNTTILNTIKDPLKSYESRKTVIIEFDDCGHGRVRYSDKPKDTDKIIVKGGKYPFAPELKPEFWKRWRTYEHKSKSHIFDPFHSTTCVRTPMTAEEIMVKGLGLEFTVARDLKLPPGTPVDPFPETNKES